MGSRMDIDSLGNPPANRIIAPGQVPREVGVQAFHAGSRSGDSARWARSDVLGIDHRVAFGFVTPVSLFQLDCVHRGFGFVDAAAGFETTDGNEQFGRTQPKQSRHRSSVGQKRSILDHAWSAVGITNDHGERAVGFAAEQLGD